MNIEEKRKNNIIIKEFLDYLNFEKGNSQKTIESYSNDLRIFFNEIDIIYDKIEKEDVYKYIEIIRQKFKNNTIQRKVAAIKHFFRFCYLNKYISTDPSNSVKNIKKEYRLPQILSNKEILAILDSYNHNPKERRDLMILKLLIATGARISEIINIEIKDIENNDYEYIKLFGKGSKYRIVPIYPALADDIKEFIEKYRPILKDASNNHRLFPDTRRESFWKRLKKHADNVGITKNVHPHVFRHSIATGLLKNGADIRVVQEILGHKTISTTELYTHVEKSTLKNIYKEIKIGDE